MNETTSRVRRTLLSKAALAEDWNRPEEDETRVESMSSNAKEAVAIMGTVPATVAVSSPLKKSRSYFESLSTSGEKPCRARNSAHLELRRSLS